MCSLNIGHFHWDALHDIHPGKLINSHLGTDNRYTGYYTRLKPFYYVPFSRYFT